MIRDSRSFLVKYGILSLPGLRSSPISPQIEVFTICSRLYKKSELWEELKCKSILSRELLRCPCVCRQAGSVLVGLSLTPQPCPRLSQELSPPGSFLSVAGPLHTVVNGRHRLPPTLSLGSHSRTRVTAASE